MFAGLSLVGHCGTQCVDYAVSYIITHFLSDFLELGILQTAKAQVFRIIDILQEQKGYYLVVSACFNLKNSHLGSSSSGWKNETTSLGHISHIYSLAKPWNKPRIHLSHSISRLVALSLQGCSELWRTGRHLIDAAQVDVGNYQIMNESWTVIASSMRPMGWLFLCCGAGQWFGHRLIWEPKTQETSESKHITSNS